jgi:signal peptidase I
LSVEAAAQAKLKLVKRIVGVPEDDLEWKSDQLWINSKAPSDYLPVLKCFDRLPYAPNAWFPNFAQSRFVVPAGEYFLLGDNVRDSLDSRFHGPVPRGAIIGKVLFIFK